MSSIKRNYFYNILVNIFNTLTPLVSFPYISRVLMPEGIGKAQFLLSFSQYFVVLASLGIPLYGIREIAKVRHERLSLSKTFLEIFAINILSSFLISLLYLLVVFNYQPFASEYPVFLLVGVMVFLSFINTDWFYSGLELFGQISIRSMIIKILSLIGLFLFVKTKEDLPIYLSITVFSFLGNQFWNVLMLKKHVAFSFDGLNIYQHIRPILLNFGVLFAISIYTVFDTILLGLLADDASVGYYSAAVKISKVIIPIITALGVVLLPRLSIALSHNNQKEVQYLTEKSFWSINMLAIPAFLGLFVFADEFILVLSGPSFRDSIIPMQILSPLVLIIGLAHFFAFQILIPAKKEKWYLFAVIAGSICCLFLNILLVPHYQALGASIANLVTELVIALLSFFCVKRFFDIKLPWTRFFLKVIYIGCLFGFIAIICRAVSTNALIVLLIGIPVCVLLYFYTVLFIEKDQYTKELLVQWKQKWFGNQKTMP